MATGRPVFRRDTPAQVLAAVIERDPEPLRRLRAGRRRRRSRRWSRAASRRTPSARFAKTDELASELAALAGRSRAGSLAERRRRSPRPRGRGLRRGPSRPSVGRRRAVPSVYHVQTATAQGARRYDEDELVEPDPRRQADRGRAGAARRRGAVAAALREPRLPPRGPDRRATRATPRACACCARSAATSPGFFITGVVMFSTQGHFPFWMAIWGAVLAVQALGAAARRPGRSCSAAPARRRPRRPLGRRCPRRRAPRRRAAGSPPACPRPSRRRPPACARSSSSAAARTPRACSPRWTAS